MPQLSLKTTFIRVYRNFIVEYIKKFLKLYVLQVNNSIMRGIILENMSVKQKLLFIFLDYNNRYAVLPDPDICRDQQVKPMFLRNWLHELLVAHVHVYKIFIGSAQFLLVICNEFHGHLLLIAGELAFVFVLVFTYVFWFF